MHMSPSGTVNRGGGGGWLGVQLGGRGLLGGAQLSARVHTAFKHTSMNKYVSVKK